MWLYIYILTPPPSSSPKKRKTSPHLEYVVIFVLHYMTYYFKKNTKLNLSLLVTYLSTISHNTSFLNFFFFGIGRYFMYIYVSEPFCLIRSTTTDRVNGTPGPCMYSERMGRRPNLLRTGYLGVLHNQNCPSSTLPQKLSKNQIPPPVFSIS